MNLVIVPTIGAHGHVRRLVRDLHDQNPEDQVVVFDNGAPPDTFDELPCTVIGMRDHGIHDMWNAGLDLARPGDDVAILNDDLRIGPGFVAGLSGVLRSSPDIAVVGPNYDGRPGSGVVDVADICAGRYDGTGGLPGFAFMLRGETGYRFPTDLRWWFGDADLVRATRMSGRRVVLAVDVTVEHIDGGSQSGDWTSGEFAEQIAADRVAHVAKWSQIAGSR